MEINMSQAEISSQDLRKAARTTSAQPEGSDASASSQTSNPIRVRHILILGLLMAFGPLSTDMYLPALPALSHDLNASMSQVQMTLSAGILGLAIGPLITGPLSDSLGRKRPLIAGIIAFILASLLCVIAPSVPVLTVLRFIQGMAGAAGIVIAVAMARDLYSGDTMARFLSLLMLVNGIAPIIAPLIGSQLLTFTNWQGIFITLAIFGI